MGFTGTDVFDLATSLGEGPEVLVLRFPETARMTLAFGITTVREASGAGPGQKQAIDGDYVVGPGCRLS